MLGRLRVAREKHSRHRGRVRIKCPVQFRPGLLVKGPEDQLGLASAGRISALSLSECGGHASLAG